MAASLSYTLLGIGLIAPIVMFSPVGASPTSTLERVDEFPTRPVTLVVPYPPAGPTDRVARIVAKELETLCGQPVVVHNIPGAGSTIANTRVAASKPDGYTLLFAGASGLVIAPHLYKLQYKGLESFSLIGMTVTMPYVLAARSDAPFDSLEGLVRTARMHPGMIPFGSPGMGTIPHLVVEMLAQNTGIELLHIPYSGGAQQMNGLLRGDVDFLVEVPGTVEPFLTQARVRLLASTSSMRLDDYPDLPTLQEYGLEDLEVYGYFALAAPAGTSAHLLLYWNALLNEALDEEHVISAVRAAGFYPTPSTIEEAEDVMLNEHERWGALIREREIRLH